MCQILPILSLTLNHHLKENYLPFLVINIILAVNIIVIAVEGRE